MTWGLIHQEICSNRKKRGGRRGGGEVNDRNAGF